jgi:hypothetical protein
VSVERELAALAGLAVLLTRPARLAGASGHHAHVHTAATLLG